MNKTTYQRHLRGRGGSSWKTQEDRSFRAGIIDNVLTTVDAGIEAGDVVYRVEEPNTLYLVTETHTGSVHETHSLQLVHLKTDVVRSENGLRDNFGRPAAPNETLLYQDVPLYIGPGHLISVPPHRDGTTEGLQHKVVLPGKYPLKVNDRLKLSNGVVMRVVAALSPSVGLSCYHVVEDRQ